MNKIKEEQLKRYDYFSINWIREAFGLSRSQINAICLLLGIKMFPIPPAKGKKTTAFILKKKDVIKIKNFLKGE